MALFRVDFAGRGELSERQQKLGSHLSDLKKHIRLCCVPCFERRPALHIPPLGAVALTVARRAALAEEFNVVVVLSNQGVPPSRSSVRITPASPSPPAGSLCRSWGQRGGM